MKKHAVLLSLLFTSSLLAVLDFLAVPGFWYWRFWWFDILMHALGGVIVSVFFVYIYFFIYKKIQTVTGHFWWSGVIFFLFIALSWEIFEYVYKLNPQAGYIEDTFLDLVAGLLGFVFTSYFFKKKFFVKSKTLTHE